MSRFYGSDWFLNYPDTRNDGRLLVSAPLDMLRDMRVLAKAGDISVAELVRRCVTREISSRILERPEIALSFRGSVPTKSGS